MPKIKGKKVKMGDRISSTQAEIALKQELQQIQQEILSMVKVDLTSNQLSLTMNSCRATTIDRLHITVG